MRSDIEFDAGRFPRAKLGFVLLATEQTIESDMHRWAPDGVGVHFSRADNPDAITATNLARSLDTLAPAAAVLAPNADLDVICYACTSGSVVMGEDAVCAELRRGNPTPKPTTLITGVLAALDAVGARKIVVATPYLGEVNRIEADYMAARGVEILDIRGLGITNDSDMARVTPAYIRDYAASVDRPDADAVFVSCGALRTMDVIGQIEHAIGKPCIASNQAMLWHCLRLAGVDDDIAGLGRLFA